MRCACSSPNFLRILSTPLQGILLEMSSGLLGLFHQAGRVAWDRVSLRSAQNTQTGKTARQLLNETAACTEYKLFWKTEEEEQIWGSMPADLVFLSTDKRTVVLVENKIGSGFTGAKDDLAEGQLAKQADFLMRCKIPNCFLILLSTAECFEKKPWYSSALENALGYQNRSSRVTGYLMLWEEILLASK